MLNACNGNWYNNERKNVNDLKPAMSIVSTEPTAIAPEVRTRRTPTLGSAEKAKQARRVTQAVSVAYHQARALSELMAMIVRDVEALPVNEREVVRRANVSALDTFSRLNTIIIDEGNIDQRAGSDYGCDERHDY